MFVFINDSRFRHNEINELMDELEIKSGKIELFPKLSFAHYLLTFACLGYKIDVSYKNGVLRGNVR